MRCAQRLSELSAIKIHNDCRGFFIGCSIKGGRRLVDYLTAIHLVIMGSRFNINLFNRDISIKIRDIHAPVAYITEYILFKKSNA